MNDPEIIIVPVVFLTTGGVALIFRWFRYRENMAKVRAPERAAGNIEDRMERIERDVEAIAVEVERVGEGQRFVTKLLAEGRKPGSGVGSGPV